MGSFPFCFSSTFGMVNKATILVSVLFLLCFCFGLYGCKARCVEEERIALLQLRDSLNYSNRFAVFNDWVGDNCCNWTGLSCNLFHSTYRVVSIEFFSYRDIKRMEEKWYPNASLFIHFKELQYLTLDGNNIGGWIMPEALCELRNLKELNLASNSLDDGGLPRCLARSHPFLREISLWGNDLNLSSPLLSALCRLRNLRVLDLSSNTVSNGSFPPCMLGTFASLKSLSLRNFTLEQSPNILTALQGARNLRVLDLSYNNYSEGSLRALCGPIRNLRTLDLSYTSLNMERIPPCLQQKHSPLESLTLEGTFTKHYSSAVLEGLLCGWKKLKKLVLSKNNFNDESLPSCLLHNNSVLEELYLSSSNFKGSLGFSIGLCKLRKLRHLDLSMNSIDNIPWTCLSHLNSLESLDLSQNQISGSIPPIFSNLTSLIILDLSNNKLEGSAFFSMFANLSKLDEIFLSNNKDLEVETEFPTWVSSFQLIYLGLENCKLRNIPSFISTQYNLNALLLSYNLLEGTIPSWLLYNATNPLQDLNLRGNYLHGPFPLPSKNETSMLVNLDISNNSIQGQLPRNIAVLFPQLWLVNMSMNKLEGYIPPSFGNIIGLEMLDLSNNFFVGKVPYRLTQNVTQLLHLILSNNNLHAMARVSNMTKLRTLNLDGNLFTRPFPITPSSVPSLVLLDISRNSMFGYIQDWLPAFPNLRALLMRGNLFGGHLPTSLCQMQQLRVLDLSNNSLSGSIPSCLNNITSWLEEIYDPWFGVTSIYGDFADSEFTTFAIHFATKGNWYLYEGGPLLLMRGIDLSLNQLSGDIPSQMGELRALHSLNLSHNSLTGYFPESFKDIKLLESLDLSHNKLVGKIPPQIIQLSFLSTFNVAFNQLSGKIPYDKQFDTFTKDSYIGNPGLCGPPTEINCSSPQPPHKEGDDEESLVDSDLFFYSCVAISYILGFWAIVAPLLLSRNWRRKYYRVVDKYIIDWCSERLFWCLFYMKSCW